MKELIGFLRKPGSLSLKKNIGAFARHARRRRKLEGRWPLEPLFLVPHGGPYFPAAAAASGAAGVSLSQPPPNAL